MLRPRLQASFLTLLLRHDHLYAACSFLASVFSSPRNSKIGQMDDLTLAINFVSLCLLFISSFRLVIELDIFVEVRSIFSCISLHCWVTSTPDDLIVVI